MAAESIVVALNSKVTQKYNRNSILTHEVLHETEHFRFCGVKWTHNQKQACILPDIHSFSLRSLSNMMKTLIHFSVHTNTVCQYT